ncbi:hypothetical protein CsSME_00036811 [Camellia sinensis var. sinensis]
MCGEAFISKLLDRKWMLLKPDTNIHQIMVSGMQIQQGQPLGNVWFSNNTSPSLGDSMMEKNNPQPSFYVVRDDLLHPLVNGNKARKLDGLLPLVEDHSVTDMVTCGGCQSAHTAAMGVIRLVQYLSQKHVFGKEQAFKIVVDAGTGTTAIGLGLGAICLGLPWEVYAVMLAENIDGYRRQEEELVSDFQRCCGFPIVEANGRFVHWLERSHPRKFGNVLTGEIEMCQQIAQQTGVLVDPIYTLAAWELATQLSQSESKGGAKVVMLHTGGTMGMFGLAQRYKKYFDTLKGAIV